MCPAALGGNVHSITCSEMKLFVDTFRVILKAGARDCSVSVSDNHMTEVLTGELDDPLTGNRLTEMKSQIRKD